MADQIQLRRLSRPQSQRRYVELKENGFAPRSDLTGGVSELRGAIVQTYSRVESASEIEQDRTVGMALYRVLPPAKFTLRHAADDEIWRYLSLDVLPDVVFKRSPTAGEDWFWRSRWRIWLKRIWWLSHLSWQGNEAATHKALQGWTTDTVAQFVERPGRGFRVDLWRGIAAESARRKVDQGHFRRVMKMNTAMLTTFEPTLFPTFLDPYVKRLFDTTVSSVNL